MGRVSDGRKITANVWGKSSSIPGRKKQAKSRLGGGEERRKTESKHF